MTQNIMLIVDKNSIKSVGGCLDLITCGGSTTWIDLQGDKSGGRMASAWDHALDQEPHFTLGGIDLVE